MIVVKLEGCHLSTCHLMLLSLIFMSREIPCDFYNSSWIAFSLQNDVAYLRKGKASSSVVFPSPERISCQFSCRGWAALIHPPTPPLSPPIPHPPTPMCASHTIFTWETVPRDLAWFLFPRLTGHRKFAPCWRARDLGEGDPPTLECILPAPRLSVLVEEAIQDNSASRSSDWCLCVCWYLPEGGYILAPMCMSSPSIYMDQGFLWLLLRGYKQRAPLLGQQPWLGWQYIKC